jgi:hypothetical protein
VRIEQKVKDPIRLKEQSHKAENIRREHKEFYYVQNDSNYELVVYESENKGKMKRKSLPINLMEAGEIYVRKNTELVPTILNKMPKVYHLRKHKMVLFYEESLEEISWENPRDLNKRLYRVSEISGDGRAKFKYHLEARNDDQLKTDLKEAYPEGYEKTLVTGKSKFIWQAKNPFPKLHLSPINFNFLLEGIHFTMTNLGEIKKI